MNIALAACGGFHLTTTSGNVLLIPATLDGLAVLRRVLESQTPTLSHIGTPAVPVQHMVDEWLKSAETRKAAERKAYLDARGLSAITLTL